MNTFGKTLGMLAVAASLTFASVLTPAAAQALDPAASSSCSTPDVPAGTISAALVETPAVAALYHLTGTTLVKVALEPDGSISDASVSKSSGIPFLDMAAVATAKASTFSPEIHDCTPVAGSYLFQVDFAS